MVDKNYTVNRLFSIFVTEICYVVNYLLKINAKLLSSMTGPVIGSPVVCMDVCGTRMDFEFIDLIKFYSLCKVGRECTYGFQKPLSNPRQIFKKYHI